jgi:hypothetical protein
VPLATVTGWNFRRKSDGNPRDSFPLLGSYIAFQKTRAAREASGDPRLSIEERYGDADGYLEQVRLAAADLIRDRYLLKEDLERVVARARSHWEYAMGETSASSAR